jgi:hypothetical protein
MSLLEATTACGALLRTGDVKVSGAGGSGTLELAGGIDKKVVHFEPGADRKLGNNRNTVEVDKRPGYSGQQNYGVRTHSGLQNNGLHGRALTAVLNAMDPFHS